MWGPEMDTFTTNHTKDTKDTRPKILKDGK